MADEVAAPAKTAQKSRGKGQTGAVAVEAALARAAKTTTDIRGIGSLQSDESVQITTEIAGRVAEFSFKEGEGVNAGDVLLKLDDALAQAELADAQARFDLAQSNYDRAQQLSRTGNVTEKAHRRGDGGLPDRPVRARAAEGAAVEAHHPGAVRRSHAASARCRPAPSCRSARRSSTWRRSTS